jgi:hypothetical protein
MKSFTCLILLASVGLLVGCAASIPPPPELIDARQAYAHASASPSTQLVPTDMTNAREALARAEKSFRDDPESYLTQDLANLAYREAKMAEALATTAAGRTITGKASNDSLPAKSEIPKQK